MPYEISATIEAEVDAAQVAVIDCYDVDFGNGIKRFWSNLDIPAAFSVIDMARNYDARIISAGDKQWTLGVDDDTLNLVVGDPTGDVEELSIKYGPNIFEGAKVIHHKLFPNIKLAFKNYWQGRGLSPTWYEDRIDWPISFGIGALKQRALRRVTLQCPHVFGGVDCGYDLSKGRGIVENRYNATLVSGTTETQLVAHWGAFAEASPGWYVYNLHRYCYAEILSIVSNTTVTIGNVWPVSETKPEWENQVVEVDGSIGIPQSRFEIGDGIRVGPAYKDCGKTPAECKNRMRWGDSGFQHGAFRNYGGLPPTAAVTFSGRTPIQEGGDRFTRKSLGNNTLYGSPIPVIFGYYRIRDIASLYYAPAGDFQHGLFIICEGEVVDIHEVRINGQPADNVNPNEATWLQPWIQHESFMKWGTWSPGGMEDERIVDKETGIMVRRCVGRRKSYAVKFGQFIDTYGVGTVFGNPYLFNTGNGDGVSLHGLVAARIRIQTDSDDTSAMSGSFDVYGLLTPLCEGMSHNLGDPTVYDVPNQLYTPRPNPIQAAYAFLTDQRWGAGVSSSKLLLSSFVSESDYCNEDIDPVVDDGMEPKESGTITATNKTIIGESERTSIVTQSLDNENGSLRGRIIRINPGKSNEFSTTIVANYRRVEGREMDDYVGGNYAPEIELVYDPNMVIFLAEAFPEDKIPAIGDRFEILQRESRRFEANGALAEDKPAGEMLMDILDNCNGTVRYNQGLLEPIIFKELDPDTEIPDIESNFLFTDQGVNRNVLREEDGRSTFSWWREDTTSIPNEYNVSFNDQARNYLVSNVQVFSEEAQIEAAKKHGEEGDRLKISDGVSLNLTTSRDQAARLLALRARQRFIQNLYCEFSTSLRRGMKVMVGDVIAIDARMFPGVNIPIGNPDVTTEQGHLLFRVLEKSETSAFVITFRCQVHINGVYTGTATDFGQFFLTDPPSPEKSGTPANVKPETATEEVIVGQGGEIQSKITAKITWPEFDS